VWWWWWGGMQGMHTSAEHMRLVGPLASQVYCHDLIKLLLTPVSLICAASTSSRRSTWYVPTHCTHVQLARHAHLLLTRTAQQQHKHQQKINQDILPSSAYQRHMDEGAYPCQRMPMSMDQPNHLDSQSMCVACRQYGNTCRPLPTR
jgi:hypothetical protein